jgi:hypothetical protein
MSPRSKLRIAAIWLLSAAVVALFSPTPLALAHGSGGGGGGGHGGGGWGGGGAHFSGGGFGGMHYGGAGFGGVHYGGGSWGGARIGGFAPAHVGTWGGAGIGARAGIGASARLGTAGHLGTWNSVQAWNHAGVGNHIGAWNGVGGWNRGLYGGGWGYGRGGWWGGRYHPFFGLGLWGWPWYGLGWGLGGWWPGYYGYGYQPWGDLYGSYYDVGAAPYAYDAGYDTGDSGIAGDEGVVPGTTPIDTSPAEGTDFYSQAVDAFHKGDYTNAARLSAHAAIDDPRNPNVHVLATLSLFAMGEYRGAAMEAHAVAAVNRIPDWPMVFGFYGNVAPFTDQMRKLEKFVGENPSAGEGRFLLGFLYLVEGHKDAAKEQLAQAVKLTPRDTLAAKLLTQIGGTAPAPLSMTH